MHLAQRCCQPLLETFLGPLLWNSFQCCSYIFFYIFSILKGRLETPRSHSELNQGKRVGVLFQQSLLGQKLRDSAMLAGALLCWRIQSLEVQAFSKHITVSSSKFGCTTTALILKCLYECTRFRTFQHIHRFCEILDDFFFHLLRPSLNRLRLPKTHDFFIAFSPYASESTAQVSLAFFPYFT